MSGRVSVSYRCYEALCRASVRMGIPITEIVERAMAGLEESGLADPVPLAIERSDAMLIGATLRCLSRTHAPQPDVAARMLRVGEALCSAAARDDQRHASGVRL